MAVKSPTIRSNMKLASGVAPVPAMLKARITVGLGTDGCASNNNLDMIKEMSTAAKLHKVARLDPTVMDARTVVRMATIEGAKALGMENTPDLWKQAKSRYNHYRPERAAFDAAL